jgi:DNA polymerase III subunit beta
MKNMKATINKHDIVDVLSKVQGLTGRRSNLAITETVLIQTNEKGIMITATDLETGYEGQFPAVVESQGTIAVSARKFYEIVRESPSSDILVEEGDNRIIDIGNENVQFNLKGMNPDDFPDTPSMEVEQFFSVNSAAFKSMIEKSIIIGGMGEDKKPHINGIFFERMGNHSPPLLRMVSTDGSRLSKFDLTGDGESNFPTGEGILLPKKGLNEISKFLGTDEKIEIGIQKNYFVIKTPREAFYIRLLEGHFPQYDGIISRTDGYAIIMDKELFLKMLKRMSILCNENYRAVMFKFDDGRLIINATNPDLGESKEDMHIDYSGETIESAFNPKYFIDAANGIDDKQMIVDIISDDKPCLISGVEDKSYLSAIMPMKV